jgi:putative two-component system response regulator
LENIIQINGLFDIDKIMENKHTIRTQQYLRVLIDELIRLDVYIEDASWDLDLVISAARLHDVGKSKVDPLILNKHGKLTIEEFETIKLHCVDGEEIINELIELTEPDKENRLIERVYLFHAKRFAGAHHEKWNGMGYPCGLSGEDIPLEGRIMAVVDVYDALVSERPYKKPFSHDEAVEIIKQDSGTHFDPKIVEAFINVEKKIELETNQERNVEKA